jgi:asparagine synthase (glutamine-hydrolysing)
LFAGYPQHVDRWLRRLLLSGNVPRFAREARATGGIAAGLRRALRDPRTTPPPWIDAGFAAATTTPLDATWRYPRNASLSEMLEVDLRYRLPSLLRYEERNSMAHGVEARLPFLDEVLVGEAHNIEDGEKIHDGVQKAVLRRAMRGVVPDVVLDRRDKLGFSTPERAWLLAERSRVKAVVLNPSFMDAGFVDRVAVRSSLDAPDEYVDTSVWWRWLSLASWLQVYPG